MTIELTEKEYENIAHALHFANRVDTAERPHFYNYSRLCGATLQRLERQFHSERDNLYPKFEEDKSVYSTRWGYKEVSVRFDVVKRTKCYVWLKNEKGETRKCKIWRVGEEENTRWGGDRIQP